MYTKHMNCDEMVREYKADVNSSQPFILNKMQEFRKLAFKAKSFPLRKIYEWKSPKYNKYLICLQTDKKMHCNGGRFGVDVMWFALIPTGRSYCLFDANEHVAGFKVCDNGTIKTASVKMYMPHAFDRYRERYGLKPGYKDIFHQMIIRNNTISYVSVAEPGTFLKSHGGDGELLIVWRDGLFLGCRNNDILHINTYLPKDTEFTSRQMEYLSAVHEAHKKQDSANTKRLEEFDKNRVVYANQGPLLK